MTVERYRLSFTTGGLFLREAPIVAERYLTLRDWIQTRDEVRSANLLQVRTATAALRISKELVSRLEHLNGAELAELIKGSLRERAYLLWSATSRQYVFSIVSKAVSTAAFVLENAHKPATGAPICVWWMATPRPRRWKCWPRPSNRAKQHEQRHRVTRRLPGLAQHHQAASAVSPFARSIDSRAMSAPFIRELFWQRPVAKLRQQRVGPIPWLRRHVTGLAS